MKGGPKSSLRPFLHRALQLEHNYFYLQLLETPSNNTDIDFARYFLHYIWHSVIMP